MTTSLDPIKARVRRAIQRYDQHNVQLIVVNDPSTGPLPQESFTTTTYNLETRVTGGGQYVEGEEVVTFDLLVVMSPIAYSPAFDEWDEIVPGMKDYLLVNGVRKTIKRIEPVPVGAPTRYRLFVQS